WALLISLTIITSFTVGSINASAHDPRYIDIKYYPNTDSPELSELSVYITHGVSDSDYHYTERILIEFYELPEWLIEEYTSGEYDLVARDENDQAGEEYRFGIYAIQEADFYGRDDLNISTLNKSLLVDEIEDIHTNQDEDLINHYVYELEIPEWTLIVITAFCSIGGAYTYSLITGHPWFDIEHHISEAILPTVILSILVCTPLAIVKIFGKKKKEEVKH
ncbi:MAG: hypothetical protein ACTSWD_04695, partial [Candidatus Heimdallarchaeota archaeon]